MTDYDKLKDVFEMAEILESEGTRTLEVTARNEDDTELYKVQFIFTENKDLVEVITLV